MLSFGQDYPEPYDPGPEDNPSIEEEPTATWTPVDLALYIDGTHNPPSPTLLARTDGACLLYPGLVHSLHGESESGKSLVMQYVAAQQLSAGQRVLYIDFEADPASVVERLLMFGAKPAGILARFDYVQPEASPTALVEQPAWLDMLAKTYSLSVIDGVTDSLGVFGYKTADNDEIAAWMRVLPKNIAKRTGAAVALVDHVTKDPVSRGRFAIGGQAKLSGLTGAAYTVEVAEPLGRGLRGVILLRVGKDRPGHVRGHSGPMRKSDRTQDAARVVVDSTVDPDRPIVTVEPWYGHDAAYGQPWRPTSLMENIARALRDAEEPLSFRGIDERVTGKQAHIRTALDLLISEGHVVYKDGPRNAKLHSLVRLYEQRHDPASDLY